MELLRAALSILFVFSLLAIAVWRLRGGQSVNRPLLGRRKPRAVEIVESGALSHGQSIHLIRVADRAFVVTAGAPGCVLLEARPWSEVPPDAGEQQ
ncbi:MAG: hypothetical protein EXQ52_16195 [Bryobacterales bacterium]|nr:hypothetical protein [Bryobacterales bacterium]